MPMFCTKCGTRADDDAKFCCFCGNRLQIPEPIPFTQPQKPINPPESVPVVHIEPGVITPKKQKNIKIVVLSVILAIAVFLTAVIVPDLISSEPNSGTNNNYNSNITINNNSNIPANEITRTIMVYIVGSDLESDPNFGGAATEDITEMVESGLNAEKNNVIICTGGASNWQNTVISSDETAYYKIVNGDVVELTSTSNKNMGESRTLSDFLNYGTQNYPADRYGVILWDHGGGPMLGYGSDENYNDMLTLDELSDAFSDTSFGKNSKLEFLGFDACLMGTIETAWIFKDYAEYFIASQELEPGYGWDYSFLGYLNQCSNGEQIGKLIIDKYFDYYESVIAENPRNETDVTLSCTKLSELDEVSDCVDNLFENVNNEIISGALSNISRCRYNSKSFGKFTDTLDYDLIDLKHITTLLSTYYKSESKALESSLDKYIVYSRTNVKNANGTSIYHPYDNTDYARTWISNFKSLGFAPKYAEYISNFAKKLTGGSGVNNSYNGFSRTTGTAISNAGGYNLTMKLTSEQANTIAGASYHIFAKLSPSQTFSKKEEYLHVYTGHNVSISANGTISALYNGKAVFGKNSKTGVVSTLPLPMYSLYGGIDSEKYFFPCMFQYFGDDISSFDIQPVNWFMRLKNGNPVLSGAYKMDSVSNEDIEADGNIILPEKGLLDSNDFDYYTFANNSYFVNKSGNDVTLEFSGSSYGFEYSKEDGFTLEYKNIDNASNYYARIVVEDIYGNTYTSDFFSLGK